MADAKELRAEAVNRLIRNYQQGDGNAFNQLMRQYNYWQYIFKALRAKRVPVAEAEDYTQQICMRLMNGLKTFRFECSFESYLGLIIRNQVINDYRRRLKLIKRQFLSLDELMTSDGVEKSLIDQLPNPNALLADENLLWQELHRVVGACLRLFKNVAVKLITCLWLYGMKQRQMAALLELSPGVVGSHLYRGQKRLRICIRKNYF
ncbi:MAG: sigma-70 family RNA polymerase sigma factor [candidate division KSB1 bacterium]|nr:sigma-70 family RNA polymerase sigma factor [candidate division KSB1 bacterium]MDZ7369371.1 sigma-70 family RNA polymerase sigma factor [candidate division KSB1 bacterium]MDZ7403206.1 sigma-70 family RNA polymerase sigma factor [candidate division KSB1 bacterium]